MKRLFLALSLALAVMSASAIPAKRGTWKTIRLADGSEVRAELRGDEFGHYWQTEDGRRFIINAETGTAEAADVKAMKANAAEKRKQASQRRLKRAPRAKASTRADDPVYEGEKKGLIILVQFDDVKFKAENTPEQFRRIANEEGFAEGNFTGSVKDYFKAQSYGRFTIDFDVAGPVTMPNGYAYYGENGIFGTDKTGRIGEMIEQACRGVEGQVDFNDYDWDGDGEADQVYVLYAGHGEADTEDPNTIWPHEYELRYALGVCPMVGGVYINTYACGPELGVGDYTAGIGTICHEFSHCMGLPDMYPTPGSEAEMCINQNLDYWDLMDAGEYTMEGYRPTEYTAWERERFGWITIDTLDSPQDVTLRPLSDGGKAYRILNDKDETGREYYIVENVRKQGWNNYLFGEGMLVFHVDYDDYQFSLGGCKVNSTPGHPRFTIIPADGMFMPEYFMYTTVTESDMTDEVSTINQPLYDKYNGTYITSAIYKDEAAGDPFPGLTGATQLTDDSTPAAKVYRGGYISKPITDITEDISTGTVSFKFMGGSAASGINEVEAAPESRRIYTTDGRYMGTNPDKLPKGLYIMGKKKIVF